MPATDIKHQLDALCAAHPGDEAIRLRTSTIKRNLDLGRPHLAQQNVDDLGDYLRGQYGERVLSPTSERPA